MSEPESVAVKYLEYMDNGSPNGDTWDDFFDHVEIPSEGRTDFAVAAILKQAYEIIDNESKD